jgi:clathrin heavy chain
LNLIPGTGGNVQAAEAIFQSNTLHHYDRQFIGSLCEKSGLYQRALEHFTELADIKRVMSLHAGSMPADILMNYFK